MWKCPECGREFAHENQFHSLSCIFISDMQCPKINDRA